MCCDAPSAYDCCLREGDVAYPCRADRPCNIRKRPLLPLSGCHLVSPCAHSRTRPLDLQAALRSVTASEHEQSFRACEMPRQSAMRFGSCRPLGVWDGFVRLVAESAPLLGRRRENGAVYPFNRRPSEESRIVPVGIAS